MLRGSERILKERLRERAMERERMREGEGEREPSAPAARPVKVSLLEVGD